MPHFIPSAQFLRTCVNCSYLICRLCSVCIYLFCCPCITSIFAYICIRETGNYHCCVHTFGWSPFKEAQVIMYEYLLNSVMIFLHRLTRIFFACNSLLRLSKKLICCSHLTIPRRLTNIKWDIRNGATKKTGINYISKRSLVSFCCWGRNDVTGTFSFHFRVNKIEVHTGRYAKQIKAPVIIK